MKVFWRALDVAIWGLALFCLVYWAVSVIVGNHG